MHFAFSSFHVQENPFSEPDYHIIRVSKLWLVNTLEITHEDQSQVRLQYQCSHVMFKISVEKFLIKMNIIFFLKDFYL